MKPAKIMESPYSADIDDTQLFVFVIPVKGIDKTAFINGLNQYNQSNYAEAGLKIEEKPLDEFPSDYGHFRVGE